ncbi:hypothetical protein P20429_3445 [Pseudoalteromonas sp. BSi20429]|nr:hypothetical protein P20429_3445 [Pseudoalteromonas sp. BSi20429]
MFKKQIGVQFNMYPAQVQLLLLIYKVLNKFNAMLMLLI